MGNQKQDDFPADPKTHKVNGDTPSSGLFLLYQAEDGQTRIQVRLEENTLWLSQKLMAELFQTTPQNITLHIKKIINDGELLPEGTCKDYLQVQEAEKEALDDDKELERISHLIEKPGSKGDKP